jgi:glycogen operon protein
MSFRGIDNASYYLLGEDKRFYFDTTGCGNTINLRHPRVLQLVMDSLRYWVEDCHVDGFRFDLASSLGREYDNFDPNAVFFDAVRQDPVLSRVKMIAEPWDLGPNGYQVGNFPPGWAEWNGRYRDDMRGYWKGDGGLLPALAGGMLASSDLFEHRGRKPWASVNFITAHDGFTLADLYAYNEKHNEANEEGNRDGHDDNRSWNCGVEGPTDNPEILDLRDRMRRNAMATLLLSHGTPMILMGDEIGRTQHGNNNAYCQDNEIAWLKWDDIPDRDGAFMEFTRGLIRLRARHPLLRSRQYLHGRTLDEENTRDVVWYKPDGEEMQEGDWNNPASKIVGMLLCDEEKCRLLMIANSYHEPLDFELPGGKGVAHWRVLADTYTGEIEPRDRVSVSASTIRVEGRSLLLFRGEA